MSSPPPPSPERFFEIATAYQLTAALAAAVDLDLFTAIDTGASTVAEIAAACHASERGVRILCDFLTIQGLLDKSDRAYRLTPDSATFLSTRSRAYMGGMLAFLNAPHLMAAFPRLADTIRRGTIDFEESTVAPDNPLWQTFARAMMPMAMPASQAIAGLPAIANSGPMKVLDIAAGHGLYGIAIAERNPAAQVVAVDWKGVLEVASQNAQRMGVGDRHRTVPGDAFTVDWGGGYDVALVTNFLHHFDAATCTTLLKKVQAALVPGGRVVVLEFVPNEDRVSPRQPAAFALSMLAGTPSGDAYTFTELSQMLEDAGFRSIEQHPLPGAPQTAVVAVR